MEGDVGSVELLDRGGGVFSQYDSRLQSRQRNRYHIPSSKASPEAEEDELGVPLRDIPRPPQNYETLDWERCMEILVGYAIGPWTERFSDSTGTTY